MKNKITKAILWIVLALVLLYVGYLYLGSAGEEPTAQEELIAEGATAGESASAENVTAEPVGENATEAVAEGEDPAAGGNEEPETAPAGPKPAGVKVEVDDCMLSGGQVHVATVEPEEASTEGAGATITEEPSQEPVSEESRTEPETASEAQTPAEADVLDPDGTYTSCEDVALYLETYGELPGNFITKKEAQALGWEGGSLEPYAPGKCIGGDKFGNYEGVLPKAKGRVYHECDIDTLGKKSRGAKRIVYSSDGLIYYTEDHYGSFTLLYD